MHDNIPQGTLIPIGGNEERLEHSGDESSKKKRKSFAILKRFLAEMRGTSSHIEIIPTASQAPEQRGKDYLFTFQELGCEHIGVINARKPAQVDDQNFLTRLQVADGVLFSGGNQAKLSEYFLGTRFHEILKERYLHDKNFVIAGTSAGAMAMSDVMIFGGTSKEAMMRGRSKLTKGLGFIHHCIIDSHFVNRGRFGRLAVAVSEHPKLLGIGLSEDTGLVIKEGRYAECIGNEHVMIFDGHEIIYKSIDHHSRNHPASFERMIFKVLAKGYQYDMAERKIIQKPN